MRLIKKIGIIFNHFPPVLRKNVLRLLISLIVCNIVIWIFGFIMAEKFPVFLGLFTLAYGLGLRHGVDADHIAAIDNTTRKFMHDGKRPISIGLFFSLGHATVVILLSLFVAFSAAFVKNQLPFLRQTGELIGLSVSSFFLIIIGIINLVVFFEITRAKKNLVKKGSLSQVFEEHFYKGGIMTHVFKPFLNSVQKSWHMYIIGFLFGLGFDTASEVGLLSISAATGASGMPVITILLLPLGFTAGMSLVDTLDGILMLGAYGWAYIEPLRKYYYNMNITLVSVFLALCISSIQGLQIIALIFHKQGGIFSLLQHFDFNQLGIIIVLAFGTSFFISFLIYKQTSRSNRHKGANILL